MYVICSPCYSHLCHDHVHGLMHPPLNQSTSQPLNQMTWAMIHGPLEKLVYVPSGLLTKLKLYQNRMEYNGSWSWSKSHNTGCISAITQENREKNEGCFLILQPKGIIHRPRTLRLRERRGLVFATYLNSPHPIVLPGGCG